MPKTKFSSAAATFICCFCAWLLLTWSFEPQELAAGAVVCLAIAAFTGRFFIHDKAFYLANPLRALTLLFYALVIFMWELIKANWDVAKRCFGGCRNVNPGIVKIPVGLKSEYGLSMLANSITLTPGTMTMEITEEDGQNYFYIHWIDVSAPSGEDAGDAIKGTLEKWVGRIFE